MSIFIYFVLISRTCTVHKSIPQYHSIGCAREGAGIGVQEEGVLEADKVYEIDGGYVTGQQGKLLIGNTGHFYIE